MDAIKIVKARLEKAEADLKACPRGANHGRVEELKSLLIELYEISNTKGGDND